ncbi:MAG: hypothetical protein AB1810_04195 [Pseudomonadota bacterium]
MNKRPTGSAMTSSILTILAIILLLVFIVAKLPRGYSDDVAKIGQGANVMVLVHNKDSVHSLNLMGLMDKVRDDYQGAVEFLVVDVATPPGRSFADKQQLNPSTLAFFGPDGQRREVLFGVENEQGLRMALDQVFALNNR